MIDAGECGGDHAIDGGVGVCPSDGPRSHGVLRLKTFAGLDAMLDPMERLPGSDKVQARNALNARWTLEMAPPRRAVRAGRRARRRWSPGYGQADLHRRYADRGGGYQRRSYIRHHRASLVVKYLTPIVDFCSLLVPEVSCVYPPGGYACGNQWPGRDGSQGEFRGKVSLSGGTRTRRVHRGRLVHQ